MCETCSDGVRMLSERYAAYTPAMASIGKTLAGAPSLYIGLTGYTQYVGLFEAA